MDEHCRDWTFDPGVISQLCRHYCTCFCILRSRGVDVYRLLRYFSCETGLNDVVMRGLFCKIINA